MKDFLYFFITWPIRGCILVPTWAECWGHTWPSLLYLIPISFLGEKQGPSDSLNVEACGPAVGRGAVLKAGDMCSLLFPTFSVDSKAARSSLFWGAACFPTLKSSPCPRCQLLAIDTSQCGLKYGVRTRKEGINSCSNSKNSSQIQVAPELCMDVSWILIVVPTICWTRRTLSS